MLFQDAAQFLIQYGFYAYFLPFVMSLAIFYGLLKKSKIFGDSVFLNGTLALAISLAIFAYPAIIGINLEKPFSAFFTQLLTLSIIFMVGLLLAALFVPDIAGFLAKIKTPVPLIVGLILISVIIFSLSGMQRVFKTRAFGLGLNYEPLIFFSSLIIMLILILLAAKVAK